MAHGHDNGYPSPTAAQAGNGVGPYPGRHQDPTGDELDLGAQLQMATGQTVMHHDGADIQQTPRADQKFSQPMYTPQSQSYQGPVQGITAPITEDGSARKKSKVSRACDECRRKKIRCDAESDAANAPKCSNCTRTNAACQFSRQPQKRGPSKGYIKELSDRVARIEHEREKHMSPGEPSPMMTDNFVYSAQKRTHSMSEGLTQLPYGTPSADRYPPNFGTTYGYTPSGPSPYANMSYHASAPAGNAGGSVLATPDKILQSGAMNIDDGILQEYYRLIHPTFPLFETKEELQVIMAYCIPSLRDAFLAALCAATSPVVGTAAGEQARAKYLHQAKGLLAAPILTKVASLPYQANLVHLQTILLLLMAVESNGHPNEQPDFFVRDSLFGSASALVTHLKLRSITLNKLGASQEAMVVYALGRRAWWTLVTLDAWSALSTASSPQISDTGSKLTAEDRDILGEPLYQFARLTRIAGYLAEQILYSNSDEEVSARDLSIGHMLTSHLDFFHESMNPSFPDTPLLRVAYPTLQLLVARFSTAGASCPPTLAILGSARSVATNLNADDIPAGCLIMHHLVLPAAMTLIEAADFKVARNEALEGLKDIVQAIEHGRVLAGNGWEGMVHKAVTGKLACEKEGLRSLADAAVGEGDADKAEERGVEWARLVGDGYANAFA